MIIAVSAESELATGWPISRVENCLNIADKESLVKFVRQRYQERFFDPIRALQSSSGQGLGYGFAIMALCSLLIESLQSYRYGLPTTYNREYGSLDAFNPPVQYEIPATERKSGTRVFREFFSAVAHQTLFPDVDGDTFYRAIRNGLLHQAQTKQGWRIRIGQPSLWNPHDKIVDRNKFAEALSCAFNQYTDELDRAAWDDDIWLKARRKLWWLMKLSE